MNDEIKLELDEIRSSLINIKEYATSDEYELISLQLSQFKNMLKEY